MTSYTLRTGSPAKTRADAVVVGIRQDKKGPVVAPGGEDVAEAFGRKWRPLLTNLGVKGKAGETVTIPTQGTIGSPLLVLVGLGAEVTPEAVRRAAGTAARTAPNATSVALALPADEPDLVRAATEGHVLGGYTFTRYRAKAGRSEAANTVVVLSSGARRQETVRAFEEAQVLASAVVTTRDWVNTPPGDLTPQKFAAAVTEAHREVTKGRGAPKVTLEVLDEEQLADLGCGGILGVGQGSAAPPRLVKLTWAPKGATRHLALVGKGITFDSGGLTIKPAAGMTTMKCDMAGAAAVLQTTLAVARLGLPVKVTAFAPMAENMVSGTSLRPGDILTMRGGRTVEVQNTDAEGRLVLADALVLATEEEPDELIDVATLTGAMVLALGERVAGVLGDDAVVAGLRAAADDSGEQLWPMPIPEDITDRVRASKIADVLQHDWTRWGGGLFAAAFLREFTADVPWAHLDIAGPAFHSGGPTGHWTAGGTGFAVATLVDHVRRLAADGA